MNIVHEFKEQIKRLEIERDVLRETLVDQIQWSGNLDRERASQIVDMKVFRAINRAVDGRKIAG